VTRDCRLIRGITAWQVSLTWLKASGLHLSSAALHAGRALAAEEGVPTCCRGNDAPVIRDCGQGYRRLAGRTVTRQIQRLYYSGKWARTWRRWRLDDGLTPADGGRSMTARGL